MQGVLKVYPVISSSSSQMPFLTVQLCDWLSQLPKLRNFHVITGLDFKALETENFANFMFHQRKIKSGVGSQRGINFFFFKKCRISLLRYCTLYHGLCFTSRVYGTQPWTLVRMGPDTCWAWKKVFLTFCGCLVLGGYTVFAEISSRNYITACPVCLLIKSSMLLSALGLLVVWVGGCLAEPFRDSSIWRERVGISRSQMPPPSCGVFAHKVVHASLRW